ncbi:MAG TPA: hydroxyethylthiazole kinase [Cellulomonas sp.]
MTTTTTWDDPAVAEALAQVRERGPLTYGLTNYIAAPLTANLLLAAGASPIIGGTIEPTFRHFAAVADGVWINLAALNSDPAEALVGAATAAHEAGTPWVLDPITVGAGSPFNDDLGRQLLGLAPTVVRGNASEVVALAGGQGASKGVDSTLDSASAVEHAQDLARRTGAVVAVSGPVDYITDGTGTVAVPGGDLRLTQVTGVGCSLGALVASFVATGPDPLRATVAAHAVLARAAETAAARTRGTGAFAVALLDEVSLLGSEER